jgi:ATP-dependent Clp protease, protease subunit
MVKDLVNNDFFIKERILFLEEDFDEESVNKLKKELLYLITVDEEAPVTLYISSFGGSVYDFLTLYGLLKNRKFRLTTIALGKCMSAGAFLLLLGDVRKAYPGTRIMFHELSSQSFGKLNEQEINLEESRCLMKTLYSITKIINVPNVKEWLAKDRYLGVNEAYKLGVINTR